MSRVPLAGKQSLERVAIPPPATFAPSVEENDEVAPGCLFLLTGVMRFVLTLAQICRRLRPPTSSPRDVDGAAAYLLFPFRLEACQAEGGF